MFSLRSLEVFYWAGHLHSFSRAAEKLNTTQPGVSQRISALENLVGEPLINRTSKPITLTSVGRVLYGHAEVVLRQVSAMEKDLALNKKTQRRVRLGVSETIVQTWLATFLEQSSREFPNIDFDITVDVTPPMLRALQEGEIDMALALGPSIVDGFTQRKLNDFPLHFYSRPGLLEGETLTYANASGFPILTYPRNTYPYEYLRDVLLRNTERPPRIFTNSSISTIEKMALDGVGIALVAEGSLRTDTQNSGLKKLSTDIVLPPLSFYAFYPLGVGGEILGELARIAEATADSYAHARCHAT
ncbi:LysR family transcriptional regulator [Rhizobium leguminosarum]|uniref:LysR family transcriptional regulator n=1 Tax=Rhizobium leguminosarum TaxID=384 RepID=UPI00098F58F2|nr:LysR family transcriptional regulator [Rhizobium leguminosarum]ASS58008.1 LysR family transcriptional regulator [Rhizobium leguminosarum bv. viciae]MBB4333278.1 DNA-binding transcriptional LysR family regulator [Rhizobium leguminosarum]MBB4358952.1 DNA-binding transcriptional LysR family regulator [Rhizobium leguminosarum]MBB4390890.1 DNA-binding transcriptional LysR family regulator [Rhizobium leguminosarum]MBB4553445.1 DNA-binding transcriptional LysR family regulator [Rhizobium leguminos